MHDDRHRGCAALPDRARSHAVLCGSHCIASAAAIYPVSRAVAHPSSAIMHARTPDAMVIPRYTATKSGVAIVERKQQPAARPCDAVQPPHAQAVVSCRFRGSHPSTIAHAFAPEATRPQPSHSTLTPSARRPPELTKPTRVSSWRSPVRRQSHQWERPEPPALAESGPGNRGAKCRRPGLCPTASHHQPPHTGNGGHRPPTNAECACTANADARINTRKENRRVIAPPGVGGGVADRC